PWSAPDTTIAMHLLYSPKADHLREQMYKLFGKDWDKLMWPGWAYELDVAGRPLIKGSFMGRGWEPDLAAEVHFQPDGKPHYQDTSIVMYAPDGAPSAEFTQVLKQRVAETRNGLTKWLGPDPTSPLKLYIYPSVERIGLRLRDMETVQFSAIDTSLHMVVSQADYGPELAYALLRWRKAMTGNKQVAEEDFIDRGLAICSQAELRERYLGFARAFVAHEKLLGIDILKNPNQRDSRGRFLYDAAAAAWVGANLPLSREENKEETRLTNQDLATLKSQINQVTDQELRRYLQHNTWAPNVQRKESVFQRGMTFAHEGYRTHNGYGGSTVKASLDSLSGLNVNSIAIVPYSYLRDPNKMGELPVVYDAGAENDEAVRYSIQQAHQRGWTTMLKPQIWINSAWPGDVDFDSEEGWNQFFDRYTEWIAHYAILAEIEGAESLCIGTELVKTTLKHPERWREMIQLLRKLYGGQLTYAANWGEEFENFTFWDALDIIGLNSYYPLAEGLDAGDEELLAGAQAWFAKAETVAEKFNKKWWLTEVGFRSVRAAWENPHAEAGSRSASNPCQERCFGAMVTAAGNAERLNGMYVWKWPSYLGHGRRRRQPGTGFTPGGKPAAMVLKAYYRDLLEEGK
ncbi:MAG: hypothetical protein AAFU03_06130, partial [Bacteroidota bacterium]